MYLQRCPQSDALFSFAPNSNWLFENDISQIRIFKFSARSEYEGLTRLLEALPQREFKIPRFFFLGKSPAHKG